jgi:hypothetical protein
MLRTSIPDAIMAAMVPNMTYNIQNHIKYTSNYVSLYFIDIFEVHVINLNSQINLTIHEFPATALMMSGLRKQATADAAVSITEPPKYMYVDRILSLTYSGHILKCNYIKT